jgi:lysozyme family protein
MIADFEISLKETFEHEGFYSDSVHDSGGKTMYGVTEAVARRAGYKGDMKDLTRPEAKKIAKELYWDTLNLSLMGSQELADKVFDAGYNCGIGNAAKWLQMAVNALNRCQQDWADIKVDGKVGKQTMIAVNTAIIKRGNNLLLLFSILHGNYYFVISQKDRKHPETGVMYKRNEMNLNGWLNRWEKYV